MERYTQRQGLQGLEREQVGQRRRAATRGSAQASRTTTARRDDGLADPKAAVLGGGETGGLETVNNVKEHSSLSHIKVFNTPWVLLANASVSMIFINTCASRSVTYRITQIIML